MGYALTVNRPDTRLKSLTLPNVKLNEAFSPTRKSYTGTTAATHIQAVPQVFSHGDKTASIVVNGKPVANGARSESVIMTTKGDTIITVSVHAKDKKTVTNYTIRVAKA